MMSIESAYLRGCQEDNLVCQTPGSLNEVTEQWAGPPFSTMMPMNAVTPRAPGTGDFPISLTRAEFIDFMLEYCYSAKI
jgi:hypothetical protein